MKIEKLNNNKIKVTLTTMDLINLDIDVEQLAPDSKELHTFLFHIMETIREETGFNPYNGQVVVEATPSREGISILVSKLCSDTKKITKERFSNAKGVKARVKNLSDAKVFYFKDFEDMCMALVEIPVSSLSGGFLYKLNNTYCFVIKNDIHSSRCSAVMAEFAAKSSEYPLQVAYIREHGRLVAKGNELVLMTREIRNLM